MLGHSRLGKAALWCGAQDTRFAGVDANDSGWSGVAISRMKAGESIERITTVFPYWFCENYKKYANREDDEPFDQHMLCAIVAPRKLYVCNAAEDIWADLKSEYLSLKLASSAYEMLGIDDLIGPRNLPKFGTELSLGGIGYMLRAGEHFLSRSDWGFYLKYFGL